MKTIIKNYLGLSMVLIFISVQVWGQQPTAPATTASQPKPAESPLKALEDKLMITKETKERIAGPRQNDSTIKTWLADMKQWRKLKLAEMKYDGSQYDRPELKWCQSSFVQPQMMVEDRYFFDVKTGKYTVDRYLDDLEKRYG